MAFAGLQGRAGRAVWMHSPALRNLFRKQKKQNAGCSHAPVGAAYASTSETTVGPTSPRRWPAAHARSPHIGRPTPQAPCAPRLQATPPHPRSCGLRPPRSKLGSKRRYACAPEQVPALHPALKEAGRRAAPDRHWSSSACRTPPPRARHCLLGTAAGATRRPAAAAEAPRRPGPLPPTRGYCATPHRRWRSPVSRGPGRATASWARRRAAAAVVAPRVAPAPCLLRLPPTRASYTWPTSQEKEGRGETRSLRGS
jgi:hypothetical protein